jgi:hypothetical protein
LRQPKKKRWGGSRNRMRRTAVQETKMERLPCAVTVAAMFSYPSLPKVAPVYDS